MGQYLKMSLGEKWHALCIALPWNEQAQLLVLCAPKHTIHEFLLYRNPRSKSTELCWRLTLSRYNGDSE